VKKSKVKTKKSSLIERYDLTLTRVFIGIIGLFGIGNLALSQVHIKVIVKVFESRIGIIFFLYILLGIVVFMSSLGMNKKKVNRGNIVLFIVITIAELVVGVKYISLLLQDVQAGNLLVMSDITTVLVISILSLVFYLIGGIIVCKGALSKK